MGELRGGSTSARPEDRGRAEATEPWGGEGRLVPATAIKTLVRGGARNPVAAVIVPLIVPFGVAFAENVTGDPKRPGTVADAIWEPGSRPSVSCTLATPFAPACDVGADNDPTPETTAQLTVTPEAGLP
jgi:hypothetical protein